MGGLLRVRYAQNFPKFTEFGGGALQRQDRAAEQSWQCRADDLRVGGAAGATHCSHPSGLRACCYLNEFVSSKGGRSSAFSHSTSPYRPACSLQTRHAAAPAGSRQAAAGALSALKIQPAPLPGMPFGVHAHRCNYIHGQFGGLFFAPQVPPAPRCTPVVISTKLTSRLSLAPSELRAARASPPSATSKRRPGGPYSRWTPSAGGQAKQKQRI
jgi:hypothetical protein